MGKDTCPTQLLDDSPTNEDKFGSHEKVAESLAELFNSGEKNGGNSIALKGTWGSGKTSVIDILEDKLNNNTKLFSYNTWSHEGDPLRRSFLEELIDFLYSGKDRWLKDTRLEEDDTWERRKKELSGKIREETVERTPNLKRRAIKFGLFALLVPLGAGLLSPLINLAYPLYFLAIIPSLLILAPVIYGSYLYYQEFWKDKEKDKAEKSRFGFIFQKSEVDIDSQTWMSPEPTSVEFQDTFSEIMDYSVSNNDRQLIIVMDNIDRIDPEEALEVWSTMRTFLDFSQEKDWVENLWLIVPFDEEAIKNVWRGRHNTEKNENGIDFNNAFLKKTFQVEVHVPRPLLSNWKEFFLEKLGEAFPEHTSDNFEHVSAEAFEEVYKVFSLQRENKSKAPTPREIKLFINKIGELHRQWGHEGYKIPLKHMALFASLENKDWEPEKCLINQDKLDEKLEDRVKAILGENWQKHLACFHIKKPPREAIEILLKPRIKNAMRNNDDSTMENMLEIKGFPHVLDQYLDEVLNKEVEQNYDIPILAKLISDTITKEEYVWRKIWNKMTDFALNVSQWEEMNTDVGIGLVKILDFQAKPGRLTTNIENLASSLSRFAFEAQDEKEIKKDEINHWLQGVMKVIKRIEGIEDVAANFKKNFYVPGSFEIYLAVSSTLDKKSFPKKYIRFFKPESGAENTIKELGNRCDQGNYNKSCLSAVRVIESTEEENEWAPLLDEINNSFDDRGKNFDDEECTVLIKTLLEIGENNEDAVDTLDSLSSNDRFAHHLYNSFNNQDKKDTGSLIFAILSSQKSLDNVGSWGQAQNGRNFIRNRVFSQLDNYKVIYQTYIELLSSYSYASFKDLVEIGKEESNNFFRNIIKTLLEGKRESISNIIDKKDFLVLLEDFPFIEDSLSEEQLSKFISELESKQKLTSELMDLEFKPDSAKLYRGLIENIESKDFVGYVISNLNSVNNDTWSEHLNKEGPLVDLIIFLDKEADQDFDIDNLGLGLYDYTEQIIDNQNSPNKKILNNIEVILSFLSEKRRTNLFDKVRDKAIQTKESSEKDIDPIIELYKHHIDNWQFWKSGINRAFQHLFESIVEEGNENEKDWMVKFIRKNSENLNSTDIHGLPDYKTKVRQKLEKENISEKNKERLDKIAEYLSIEKKGKNSEETS